ncbi:MAG: OmpH family outer membrane protein [Gammaproteobacteria bacterium]|nr:OmpH family outer membrane protein [Gammaproteobacteria bacterium]
MKKVLAILSSILLLAGANAFAADATATPAASTPALTKIAVVNVQQVLMQSSKVAKVNTKLQDQFKPRQEKLTAQQKTLQDEVDKYSKESPTMSQKDRDATEKKIGDEKAAFLKDAGAFQKEVNAEQNKAMQSILGQLSGVISGMAKKENYTLVLDSQAVVYASDATDITKQVAKEFNKE